MKLIISHEVGGQDIEWHVVFTPGTPDTRHEPGYDSELNVERAMLLTHMDGNRAMRLDLLDLLEEAGGGQLSELIYSDLLERAEDAAVDTSEAEAESAAEALRDRAEGGWSD